MNVPLTSAPSQLEARARVKAQIEADKRERAEKAAREKALREGKTEVATPAPSAPRPAAPSAGASASNASEARLRVRAPGGQWMGTVPADSTLVQVESMILEAGKADAPLKVSRHICSVINTDGTADRSLTHLNLAVILPQFSQTFPRKFFTDEEKTKSLRELGLVPNAALEATLA